MNAQQDDRAGQADDAEQADRADVADQADQTDQTDQTDRYRRVLALLPRAYREQRGDEMLGVMLDAAADEGRRGPSLGELVSVLALSLRLRTGAPGGSLRAQSVGETLRLITLIGLLLQAINFTAAPAVLLRLWRMPVPGYNLWTNLGALGDWRVVSDLSGFVCPFLALAALLSGRRRLGLILTSNALTLIWSFHLTGFFDVLRYPSVALQPGYAPALCVIPTVAGLLGFHREAPRVPRPRLWLAAAFLLSIPVLALDAISISPHRAVALNLLAIVCGCTAIGIVLSRARRGGAVLPVALMVAGAPLLLLLRPTTAAYYFDEASAITPLLHLNPIAFAALGALAVEVLLAVTLAVSLTWRLRATALRRAANSGLGGREG